MPTEERVVVVVEQADTDVGVGQRGGGGHLIRPGQCVHLMRSQRADETVDAGVGGAVAERHHGAILLDLRDHSGRLAACSGQKRRRQRHLDIEDNDNDSDSDQ